MAVTAGYYLSAAIAVAIILIGARFMAAPQAAAAGYGVPVEPDARWGAYLSVKAVRDIASGLFTTIVIFQRSTHLLAWFMLAATIIPLADAIIVLKHQGTKSIAFGVHGSTAVVMLIATVLLLAA
jgi:Domain of unknown function (DUF4267)